MKKSTVYKILGIIIIIVLVGWGMFEDIKQKNAAKAEAQAAAQKIYTTSEILKDADFSVQETAIEIRSVPSEPFTLNIENENQRKQLIYELANLKFRQADDFHYFDDGIFITLTLNEDYHLYLFEDEQNIYFRDGEYTFSFDIIDGKRFFEALNKIFE